MRNIRTKINNAKTHNDLDVLVQKYLLAIGELYSSRNESYQETADRLDDDIMLLAADKWYDLEYFGD